MLLKIVHYGDKILREKARPVPAVTPELVRLAEVLELPGQRVYVVRGETEHLIPAVPAFILNTDAEAGRITVRLIEGM